MVTHPYSSIPVKSDGMETEASNHKLTEEESSNLELKQNQIENIETKKLKIEEKKDSKTAFSDESIKKEVGKYCQKELNEDNMKNKIGILLIEIAKSSENKDLLFSEINGFFSNNKFAIKYLYNKEYPLINRLHLLTKIDLLRFKLEEIFSQIKEGISKCEKENLRYLDEYKYHKDKLKWEYKNRDVINISYFLNILHDSNKIKTEDFYVIKTFSRTGLKEKMWKEGEKMFSDYKFRSEKKIQKDKWLTGREAKETEIIDLYSKQGCNISLPFYNLIRIHYNEIQERLLNTHTEGLGFMEHNLLIINFEEFLRALNEYENFQTILINTMHSLLDFKNLLKTQKEEIKKEVMFVFKSSTFVIKLKDLCYFLIKLQQTFIIRIDVHQEFINFLIEFLKDEFCIKVNIKSGDDINDDGICIPSNLISIDDFFDILYIRMSITNL